MIILQANKIERSFAEIADVAQIFQEYASFGFGHSQDISESLRRLELGADLNTQELLAVKRILQMSAELKDFYDNLENVDLQILDCLFEKIETFPDLQGSFYLYKIFFDKLIYKITAFSKFLADKYKL